MQNPHSEPRVLIAVCSRGPNPQLRKLVPALARQAGQMRHKARVVIVANAWEPQDLESFGCELTTLDHQIKILLTQEREAGIPAARNRALDVAYEGDVTYLVFIDDDCLPYEGWLENLIETALSSKSDVVAGGWRITPGSEKSKFLPDYVFGQKRYSRKGADVPDQGLLDWAYTRSVLFNVSEGSMVRREGLRFDESRSRLGGSDVMFFMALSKLGAKLTYCEQSMVEETYRDDRLTLRWWFWRKFRNAQFRFERGELTTQEVLNGALEVVKQLLAYGVKLPSRSKRGLASEALGHLLLSLAPLFGLVSFWIYRYKSY